MPKRLFTFGCSFTEYIWSTWPEIVAYDLQIPLYNYGKSAAGNQYIFNMIMQADAIHKFNESDLIMICWTSTFREDRYIKDKWHCYGNMLQQKFYSKDYVEKYADPMGYLVRDLASISAVDVYLQHRGCRYHHMQMTDLTSRSFPWIPKYFSQTLFGTDKQMQFITGIYKPVLEKLLASFYSVLWDNDIQYKTKNDLVAIHPTFRDGHPLPEEHLMYLQKIYEHKWRPETVTVVKKHQSDLIKFVTERAINNVLWVTPDCNEFIKQKIVKTKYLEMFQ